MHLAILAAVCYGAAPGGQVSVGLDDMAGLLRGDVRVIAMGDSYSVANWNRIPTATLLAWPYPHVTAFCGGSMRWIGPVRCREYCEPVSQVRSADSMGYAVERGSKPLQFYTLPVRGIQELHADDSFSAGEGGLLFEHALAIDEMAEGVHGPVVAAGDTLGFRMLYRAPSDPAQQPPAIELRDLDELRAQVNPVDAARGHHHLGESPADGPVAPVSRQINAIWPDIVLNNDSGGGCRVRLTSDQDLGGSGYYLQMAGGVYWIRLESGARAPGLYLSTVADDTWDYVGFGSNAEGTGTHDKRFARPQFTNWLDATTLDIDQPVLFMWLFAIEASGYDVAIDQMEAMIEQADAAASEVGLANVRHMLVIPHMRFFSGYGQATSHGFALAQQSAAFELAQVRPNVAAASIYAATDGVLFDGGEEGNTWLLAHGFDAFQYGTRTVDLIGGDLGGDLLDQASLHPFGTDAAAFFAAILGDLIREAGCPADLSGDGTISVADLLLVIDGWGGAGNADATGDGIIDLSDLLAVIAAWGDCWPLQSPFGI